MDKPKTGSGSRSTPGSLPPTSPLAYPGTEHSWTLQTVFELQKNVGQLTEAVKHLDEHSKDNGKKLDRMSHIIYAAGVVLALLLAVGGWTLKIASDIAVSYFNNHQTTQQPITPK